MVSDSEGILHETGFVKSFVVKEKQDRWTEFLRNPKRRSDVLGKLAHAWDIPTEGMAPNQFTADGVERALRAKGPPDTCWVISRIGQIDGKSMKLREALDFAVGQGLGTVVSCVPGRLCYYESDGIQGRWILEA